MISSIVEEDATMLLKYTPGTYQTPTQFYDLAQIAFALFAQATLILRLPRTVVFGPMRKGTESAARNLQCLQEAATKLAERGDHAVLDLVSFQDQIERLKTNYEPERIQQAILDEFTFQLIQRMDVVHFLSTWQTSPGARAEHAEAIKRNVPIRYVN